MFEKNPLSNFKGLQMCSQKETGSRVLLWQQHRRGYSVYFLMDISGAKFEEHCSNISGDILDKGNY